VDKGNGKQRRLPRARALGACLASVMVMVTGLMTISGAIARASGTGTAKATTNTPQTPSFSGTITVSSQYNFSADGIDQPAIEDDNGGQTFTINAKNAPMTLDVTSNLANGILQLDGNSNTASGLSISNFHMLENVGSTYVNSTSIYNQCSESYSASETSAPFPKNAFASISVNTTVSAGPNIGLDPSVGLAFSGPKYSATPTGNCPRNTSGGIYDSLSDEAGFALNTDGGVGYAGNPSDFSNSIFNDGSAVPSSSEFPTPTYWPTSPVGRYGVVWEFPSSSNFSETGSVTCAGQHPANWTSLQGTCTEMRNWPNGIDFARYKVSWDLHINVPIPPDDGTLGLEVTTSPWTPSQEFTVEGSVPASFSDGNPLVAVVPSGSYSEALDVPNGWTIASISCSQGAEGDVSSGKFTYDVVAGLSPSCDVTLKGSCLGAQPSLAPAIASFTPMWLGVEEKNVGLSTSNDESFDAASSGPADTICSYDWDFHGGGGLGAADATGITVTHSFPTAGHYPVTLTVIDSAGDESRSTMTVTVNAVYLYAPAVSIDPHEKYFPDSTDSFIQAGTLKYFKDPPDVSSIPHNLGQEISIDKKSCKPSVIAAKETISELGLGETSGVAGYSSPGWTGSLETLQNGDGVYECSVDQTQAIREDNIDPSENAAVYTRHITSEADQQGFYIDEANNHYSGNSSLTTPVYTEYQGNGQSNSFGSQSQYIIYWFFYDYNGFKSQYFPHPTENHEGDWEHIVVRLDPNDTATDVDYYQHYCNAESHSWSSFTNVSGLTATAKGGSAPFRIGDHPIVFSALGGHGSYASATTTTSACGDLQGYGDVTQIGKQWSTWKNISDARNQPWYGSAVDWGDRVLDSTLIQFGPWGPGPASLDNALK
jgi:PKD domain